MIKIRLTIYFDYDNKPDDDKEQEISDLLISFGEFCEFTDFRFSSIPGIGEYIVAEPLLKKWIDDKNYKKTCLDNRVFSKIHQALRTGYFTVEEIYHSPDNCSIHCSDIEYTEKE